LECDRPIDVIQGLPLEDLHLKLHEGNLDDKEIAKAKAGQKKISPKVFLSVEAML